MRKVKFTIWIHNFTGGITLRDDLKHFLFSTHKHLRNSNIFEEKKTRGFPETELRTLKRTMKSNYGDNL